MKFVTHFYKNMIMISRRKIISYLFCFLVFIISYADGKDRCIVKGRIYTEQQWYGYLVQKTFQSSPDEAKIEYQLSYPEKECCANLLIYYDDQVKNLKDTMSCHQRQTVLPADNHQIISLVPGEHSKGCVIDDASDDGERLYICKGERSFRSSGPRTWYFAISRCDSTGPFNLNYFFNISGFYGDCEVDPLSKTIVPPRIKDDTYVYVSVALGIVAGVAIMVAAVFILLWFQGRIRSKKGASGSSVTSSEARTTPETQIRDIFYVNPSLSDREQTDYSGSASSENYYEVIPERRSYESVNTHLTIPGHPINRHHHNTHVKDHHHRQLQTYVFNDYPPPPYQPPQGASGSAPPAELQNSSVPQTHPEQTQQTFHGAVFPKHIQNGHPHLSPMRPPLNRGLHSNTMGPRAGATVAQQNGAVPGTSNHPPAQLNHRIQQLETSLC